jgi:hypothetical protein
LAFAVLRHTVYCQVALIEKDLARGVPEVPSQVEFEVALLIPENVDAYSRYRPDTPPEEVLRRLERGSLCYVTWEGESIVSCAWYQPREAWIEDIDRRFQLPPDCVYVYDGYTSPERRGRSLSSARAAITWADLSGRGFHRGVGFVLAGNRSGDRARTKAGWRRFGVGGYARLGPWRLEFIRSRGRRTRWRFRRAPRRAWRRRGLPPLEPADALLG